MEDLSNTSSGTANPFLMEDTTNNYDFTMKRSILCGSLIYMIISYLNTFGNIAMYLVSYMRVYGNNPTINYNIVSFIFSCAVLLQSLSGFFTSFVERALGTRKATILGCSLTAFSLIACSFNLHNFSQMLFFYSVVGGIASGLILPLPLDAAVRSNPSKRGYICGSVYFYGGLLTVLMCPVQTFFINKGDVRLGDIVSPSDKEVYYKDVKLLHRLPKLFVLQGVIYLVVLAVCVIWLDFPRDRDLVTDLVKEPEMEYETFVTKRLDSDSSAGSRSSSGDKHFMQYLYLWFLIYLSWQSIIYLQSYWKIVALLKLDGSDFFITMIGAAASASNILGRIAWGIIFDLIGWRYSWIILVISTLVLTFTSHLLFRYNLAVYALWVTSVFFIHAGVFSIGPMTAHHFFGPKKFIMSVGFLNTARAASGLTALIYANFKFSRWNDYLPITISLICLSSLFIIRLFKLTNVPPETGT